MKKEFQTANGAVEVLVDDKYGYLFDDYKWSVMNSHPKRKEGFTKFYIQRHLPDPINGRGNLVEHLHRFILEQECGPAPKKWVADHINGNELDCTSANLRWVTRKENNQNKRGGSKYIGVRKFTRTAKGKRGDVTYTYWAVFAGSVGKAVYKGMMKTEEEAAKLYAEIMGNTELAVKACMQ